LYIKQAQYGRGTPAFGSINPAMRYYYDPDIGKTSNQRFDLEAARKLLADAGYPGGEGFPKLKVVCTPSAKREVTVIANMLKKNLNIDLELDIKDFPVLLDQFDTMQDWDIVRVGSGGDFDPDDGLVDWMETTSKFNGRRRDKSKYAFGYFSDTEVDQLTEQERVTADPAKRKVLVQKANKITSDKVASVFIFHPADILVYRKNVNFPDESRIPGLVDLDRTSIS
jgi:ABC-type transport system substrate-binding protein